MVMDIPRQLVQTLYQFQEDGYLCDSVLITEDGQLRAHSAVLAAASPVFKAAMEMQGGTLAMKEFWLNGIGSSAAKIAIRFMYTGELVTDGEHTVPDEMAMVMRTLRCMGLKPPKVEAGVEDNALLSTIMQPVQLRNRKKNAGSAVVGTKRKQQGCIGTTEQPRQQPTATKQQIPCFTVDNAATIQIKHEQDVEALDHESSEFCINHPDLPTDSKTHVGSASSPLVVAAASNGDNMHCVTVEITTDDSTAVPKKKKGCRAGGGTTGNKREVRRKTGVKDEAAVDDDVPQLCEECGEVVPHIRSHMAAHARKRFVCDVCNRGFSMRWNLIQHRGVHRDSTVDDGGSGTLNRRRRHINARCTLCELCGKSTKCIALHMRVHTGDRPYACDACGRRFSVLQNLVRHRKCHTGERPYVCQTCGRGFIQRASLVDHIAIHHPDPDRALFTCRVCDERFARRLELKRHVMQAHASSNCPKALLRQRVPYRQRGSSVVPTPCRFCNRVFVTRQALESHERVHTGARPFRCDACGRDFRQISHLRSHLRTHTGERPFACGQCQKSYKNRVDLRMHCMRVHQVELPVHVKQRGRCRSQKKMNDNSEEITHPVTMLAKGASVSLEGVMEAGGIVSKADIGSDIDQSNAAA